MLPERTFTVGGVASVAFGVALLGLLVAVGGLEEGIGAIASSVGLIGFGAFFLYVGRAAARDRAGVLALAGPPATLGGGRGGAP